eukprot:COSAG06_NODE_38999_length_416_cov_1.100629_2_plen_35_part_01
MECMANVANLKLELLGASSGSGSSGGSVFPQLEHI